jgi:hypothetical protein
VINAKLKDAIAIRPDLVHVRKTGCNEGSSGKGNQGDAANVPLFECPVFGRAQLFSHSHFSWASSRY